MSTADNGASHAPIAADDNPANPYQLTELQSSRSVQVLFEYVSSFQVRYAIGACCTTGRNFLFGGCARVKSSHIKSSHIKS